MTTFVLIPGAGGSAWYWHRVAPLLRAAGYEAVAVELPTGDDAAGLSEYTDTVLTAINNLPDHDRQGRQGRQNPQDGHGGLVVVGMSLGAFIAPLICAQLPVELLVLVNGMIPAPGETAGEWWGNTGSSEARVEAATRDGRPAEFDLIEDFFHDVPAEVAEAAMAMGEPAQSDRPFADPWPLPAWPNVPTRVLSGRDDRFFPVEFQRRVAHDRLGLAVDEIPGGHLVALSRPQALVDQLIRYLTELESAPA